MGADSESPRNPTYPHQTYRLLDAGLVGVFAWDIGGGVVDANETLLQMLGFTRDDLEAGTIDWIRLTPPELRERDSQPIADLYATGKHLLFEKEFRRKDGTRVPILIASAFNEGSRTNGATFVIDISAQKQAENQARERSELIETIFESMTDAFFALDTNWRFTYLNTRAESLLRRTRDELIGCPFREAFPKAVTAFFNREFRKAVKNGQSITTEGFYPLFDAWFEVRAFPSPAGLSIYFRNITSRKHADQERERLVAELKEASARQRRFLKEMLAAFTEGRLHLCFTEAELPQPLPSQAAAIELSPQTLRHLRQQVEVEAERLSLPAERMYDLITAVGEGAMNAVRHGGGGQGTINVNFEASVIQIWIQDHGTGIPEEDLHRATLEKGWSGANSFGHGFSLMLKTVDRTYLLTGPKGTTIVLEQERTPPEPDWLKAMPPSF